MEGDDRGEAYTAIMRGVGVNHESDNIAGVETLLPFNFAEAAAA